MGPGFCADLDQIEALTGEREALWARLNAVSFLTANEKRAAVGYGPLRASDEEALVTGPFDDRTFGKFTPRPALKYRPDQPRIPAGNSQGGRWVDEGLGGGSSGSGRLGGGGATPREDRIAGAKLPRWILEAFRKGPKVLKPSEKPLHELFKPGGKEIGVSRRGADDGIRTLQKSEFEKFKTEVLDGAVEVAPPKTYDGRVFSRPDGSLVGVRKSDQFGETIDVIKSPDPSTLSNGFKVHSQ